LVTLGIGLAKEQACDEVSSISTNPDLSLDAGIASFRSAGNSNHVLATIARLGNTMPRLWLNEWWMISDADCG
jgi:hypothetical protein